MEKLIKVPVKLSKEVMHVQDFVWVDVFAIARLNVEVRAPIFVFTHEGDMDNQLVFAVMAGEVKEPFVLVG